jgi:hypothetical protein
VKKTRLAAVALMAGVIPVLLSGCVGSNSPTKAATHKPAASSATPAAPIVVPQPSSKAELQQQNTVTGYASQAAKAFPSAKATPHFSKLEVQEALYSANQFTSQALNSPNFLSGRWAQTGYRSEGATQFINYLTPLGFQHMQDLMTATRDKDAGAADKLFSVVPWFPATDGSYQVCSYTVENCQENGYPKLSNYGFGEDSQGTSIEISLTAVSRVSTTVKGVKGYLPMTHTLQFRMVKNDKYKGGVAAQPFLINGWTTKYVSQSWTH